MKKKNIILIVLIALVVLAAAAFIFIYSKLSLIKKTKVENVEVSEIFKKPPVDENGKEIEGWDPADYDGYEIVALVGLDTRDASAYANSDTMILACVNHDEKTIKLVSLYRDTYLNIGGGKYSKCNAAYCSGGPERFLSMINTNLDLNVTKFVTTNFNALAKTIDILGGLDIEMTRQELIHMNNYNVETSKVCGVEYQAVEVPPAEEFDGVMLRNFHLTGTQAVSYARIRYTEGWDYRRTERQRLVLSKIKDKVKEAGPSQLLSLVDTIFPEVTTNLSSMEIIDMAKTVVTYDIVDQSGFPFDKKGVMIAGLDAVVPVTLRSNVVKLHEFLYPGIAYSPSGKVCEISDYIVAKENEPAPTPSLTPEPTPTATPTPTPTMTPTNTPTPIPEPTATPTPEPEPEPEPEPGV
ncbi:MAG: LCP family protein [Lachnospiraceae bacterium]|nr:LCP family protein [Lachnospiraceae bacterium]